MKIKVEHNPLSDKLRALDKQMAPSDDPIPEAHFVWAISGMKGSGKSSLIINVMRSHLRKKYDNIFLFSPTAKVDGKWKDIVDELEPENKWYNLLTETNLYDVLERIKSYNEDNDDARNIIIFDDCLHELKGSGSKSYLNKLITTCRHFKTSVVIITQKYNKLNTTVRANMDLLSIFATQNKKELSTIIDDINVPEDIFRQIFDFCVGEGGNKFLHISLFQAKVRWFKCFDRIHIMEE